MTMAARKERILPKRPALKLVATNKHFQKPTSTTKTSSTRTQHTRKPFPGVVPIKASASSPASIRLTREQETKYTAEIRVLKSAIRTRDDLAAANHDREHDSSSSSSNNSRSSSNNNKNQQQHTNNNPLAKALKYQIGPSEEEWAKQCNLTPLGLRKVLIRGREARKHLVAANVGLVMQISRKYANELKRSIDLGESNGVGTILTLQDMIQEGNLGIMEAAERFDPKKGARFGTYASYWIKQRILRSIADNSRTIRLPAHGTIILVPCLCMRLHFLFIPLMILFLSYYCFYCLVHSTLRTIRRARHDLQKEIGRAPSMPELAHHLGMPIEKIQLYTDSSRSVLSLESPISKNGKGSKAGTGDVDKRSLGDRIASDSPTPEEMSELDALRIDIRKVIDGLGNDRERDVLLCRFGLEDGNPRTLQETAQHLGISRERVRMVEARALNKLRHPQRNYRLKDYVGEHHHVEEDDPMRIFKQQNFQDPQGYPEGLSPEKMWSF